MSKWYNLYKEVSTQSPGRKAATVNYGIQVGLSQTSLGNNGLRKTLVSAKTPPPARKSLQNTSNKKYIKDLCLISHRESINAENYSRRT